MRFKNDYTFIKSRFGHRLSLILSLTAVLAGLFLSSCDMMHVPVRGYLEKYTNEIAIEKLVVEGESYYDKYGNLCIPSGQDVQITLILRNPYHFYLGSTDSTEGNFAGLDYNVEKCIEAGKLPSTLPEAYDFSSTFIEQDADDKTLLHFTYDGNMLSDRDKEGYREIGGIVTVTQPFNKDSHPFTFNIQSNSKPPEITNAAVMTLNNGSSDIYYLCFSVPIAEQNIAGKHDDLDKIIINNGNSSITADCEVGALLDITFIPVEGLGTTEPGNLRPISGSAAFSAASQNNFYYNSGIVAVDDKEQSFTITLVDEAGLSRSTVISTSSKHVKAPVLKDETSGLSLSTSSQNTLSLNTDYNAQITIIPPTEAINEESISGATVSYELKKGGFDWFPIIDDSAPNTLILEETGTYTLTVWSDATGYLSSARTTYTIKVPPLTVTFNKNGGDSISTTTQTVNKFEATTLKTASELGLRKTGHHLAGWATTPSGELEYQAECNNFSTARDITLFAKWEPNTYTLTLDPTSGSVTPSSISVTYGSTYGTLPTPERYGYNFADWYTSSSGGTKVTANTTYNTEGDSTIYAHWTAKTPKVTYNLNGASGTPPAAKTVTYNKTYYSASALTSPSATKLGYQFKCWCLDAAGTQEITSTTKVSDEDNHVLWAKWTPKQYTMRLNLDSSSAYFQSGDSNSIIFTIEDNTKTLPKPKRAGVSFDKWVNESPTTLSISVLSTSNMSYTLNITATTPETIYVKAIWDIEDTISTGADELSSIKNDTGLWSTLANDPKYAILNISNMSDSYLDILRQIIGAHPDITFHIYIASGSNITIPEYFFKDYTNIRTLDLKGVKEIGNHAFDGCTGLRYLTLRDGLEKIDYGAFEGCSALSLYSSTITIPSSVTYIGAFAFRLTGYNGAAFSLTLNYTDSTSQWGRYDYNDDWLADLNPKQPTVAQINQMYNSQMHYKKKP